MQRERKESQGEKQAYRSDLKTTRKQRGGGVGQAFHEIGQKKHSVFSEQQDSTQEATEQPNKCQDEIWWESLGGSSGVGRMLAWHM